MKRLMIVADHSFVVQAIRLALRQTAGFQVVGFFDGRQADPRGARRARAPTSSSSTTCRSPSNALARLREVAEHAPDAKALLLTAAGWTRSGSTRSSRPAPTPSSPRPSTRSPRHAAARDRAGQRRPAPPPRPAAGRRRRTARSPTASWRSSRLAARGLHQRPDRPRAVGDRADGQVPPLEHLPQARRRQPHRGQPLRPHARPGDVRMNGSPPELTAEHRRHATRLPAPALRVAPRARGVRARGPAGRLRPRSRPHAVRGRPRWRS